MTDVGIDAIDLWVGNLKLDLPNTFAPAMGEDPAKYTKGLGLHASSFPDTYEDIVTMAANASYRLMTRNDLTPSDVGRIDVATETAFDKSKPVSTYVAGCLEQVFDEDFRHANKGERKFACIAGTQSLDDAYNWIAAGRNRGRGALVIATDTALYARGDAGEATQGAGAVAMYIDEDPDIVAFSKEQGIGSADETDFLKPNQQFPSVDGHRSMQVYLARMREALEDFKSVAGTIHPEEVAYGPFHTPFPGMVRKAAVLAYRNAIRDTDIADEIESEVGRQPDPEDFEDHEDYLEALREFTDALRDTDRYLEWYQQRIDPTLRISEQVGNWYTGSVHIARASALLHALENDRDLVGERMVVASYGSGTQAEIHAETIRSNWRERVARLEVDEQLASRYDLDFEEYERVHDNHNLDLDTDIEPLTTPSEEFVFDGWGPMGERQYRFVE
ncbi:MAG: hydroxymethylglutaryl-CoA synthase [Halobacteriales archaeon]